MLKTWSFLLKAIAVNVQKMGAATRKERARLFSALIAREATEDDLPAAAYLSILRDRLS